MAITGKQRRALRALAHPLKPVVIIGQRGITDGVVKQVDDALTTHELIKVRIGSECPVDRDEAAAALGPRTRCEIAGAIGRVLILYRAHPEKPRIRLDPASSDGTEDA